MHIGLIGGIGPAATDFYHRRLIAAFAARKAPLDLTIVHADTPTLLDNLTRNDVAAQVAIYARLTERLAAACADHVVVSSISGHFCIEAFKAISPLPVIDMITEVGRRVATRGLARVGILGTRTVMESRFYGGIPGVEIILPEGSHLDAAHQAYVEMATAGVATDAHRETFQRAGRRMIDQGGAEAIMLGGTDLALVFDETNAGFAIVDCAGIHVDAVVRVALG